MTTDNNDNNLNNPDDLQDLYPYPENLYQYVFWDDPEWKGEAMPEWWHRNEDLLRVLGAIYLAEHRYYKVLLMFWKDGLSIDEIAESFNNSSYNFADDSLRWSSIKPETAEGYLMEAHRKLRTDSSMTMLKYGIPS